MSEIEILLVVTILIMSISFALVFYKLQKEFMPMTLMLKINSDQLSRIVMLTRAIDAARMEIPYMVSPELVLDDVVYKTKMWDERVREILDNSFRFDDYLKDKNNGV